MPSCLECKHLAPLARIKPGDPLEIQYGHQGMLARGLCYCGLKVKGKYKLFRPIESSVCADYLAETDAEKIGHRHALATRLQADFARWYASLKAGKAKKPRARKESPDDSIFF